MNLGRGVDPRYTLPETNGSHLKMDGWKTIVSFWDGLCSGAMLVSGSVIDPIIFLDKDIGKYSSPIRRIWDRVDIK